MRARRGEMELCRSKGAWREEAQSEWRATKQLSTVFSISLLLETVGKQTLNHYGNGSMVGAFFISSNILCLPVTTVFVPAFQLFLVIAFPTLLINFQLILVAQ